jgi:hypothetical protein
MTSSSSRSRYLLALDRMIESVQHDVRDLAPGNFNTRDFLSGELKGLRAARAYAEAEEARIALSESGALPSGVADMIANQQEPDADLRRAASISAECSGDKHDEADRLVSITVGGSTHVRTAGEWLALARASLSHGGERSGCPCTVEGIEPCSYACSCAHPFMSGGCQRCAAYGSLEQRQAAARRLISSATTRGPWPLDTLIGRALDDLYRAYGIDFPRTNSDLRRCFSVAEKYLAATESRNDG